MKQIAIQATQEEWLRVLGKGMVTLPKNWRDELGITTGDIIRAKKIGRQVIIEPSQIKHVPYRTYSAAEIAEFLREDTVSDSLKKKVQKHLSFIVSS